MRILAITSLYPRPGRPNFVPFHRRQFRELASGHEFRVVAPIAWTEAVKDIVTGRRDQKTYRNVDGIEVHHPLFYFTPGFQRQWYGESFLASVRPTVEMLVREQRPDVLLSAWTHPDGWAVARLGRELGIPTVMKVMGSDVHVITRDPRRRAKVSEAIATSDGISAVSRDLAARVIELGANPERVRVIPEGIDGRMFSPGDRAQARIRLGLALEEKYVLFVGNLLLSKGAGVLVDACRLWADRGTKVHTYLVGGGRDEGRIRAMIAKRGLGSFVTLVGPRPIDELPDWYRSSDVVVLPSFSEGIPNVLREATACDRPFVSTRVGGIPEISEPAISRLVAPGSAEELAQAVALTLAEPPAPGVAAAHSRNISWPESARLLVDFMRDCGVHSDRSNHNDADVFSDPLTNSSSRRPVLNSPRGGVEGD